MKEIKISNIKPGEKLAYFIEKKYPNLPLATLHKALRNKDIKVNGKRTSDANYNLASNDVIQIYIDDTLLYGLPKQIDIAYEDDNILIANKPQGVLSNNEGKSIDEVTFEDYVKKNYGENITICHRLDRNTSGLLIFAKNDNAYNEMLQAFKDGYVYKEYIAYVYGTGFEYKSKKYEKYILTDNSTGFSKIYDNYVNGSQKIITEVSVEKENTKDNYSIVRVLIHTGKTHQIRAQLAAISHPIIGDSKYGKNEINRNFKKYKQMLFATKYTFNFPKESVLNYLNNITVNLDTKFYMDKLQKG